MTKIRSIGAGRSSEIGAFWVAANVAVAIFLFLRDRRLIHTSCITALRHRRFMPFCELLCESFNFHS